MAQPNIYHQASYIYTLHIIPGHNFTHSMTSPIPEPLRRVTTERLAKVGWAGMGLSSRVGARDSASAGMLYLSTPGLD